MRDEPRFAVGDYVSPAPGSLKGHEPVGGYSTIGKIQRRWKVAAYWYYFIDWGCAHLNGVDVCERWLVPADPVLLLARLQREAR